MLKFTRNKMRLIKSYFATRYLSWLHKGIAEGDSMGGVGPIIVVGPPRSGTSITARCLQLLTGDIAPYEVSNHQEPVEIVNMTNSVLLRNGMNSDDRLFPAGAIADVRLVNDVMQFLVNQPEHAIVKEPILTHFLVQAPLHLRYRFILVDRAVEDRARSFRKRKSMPKDEAQKVSLFWEATINKIKEHCTQFGIDPPMIYFSDDKQAFSENIERICPRIGLRFDASVIDKIWEQSNISDKPNG